MLCIYVQVTAQGQVQEFGEGGGGGKVRHENRCGECANFFDMHSYFSIASTL